MKPAACCIGTASLSKIGAKSSGAIFSNTSGSGNKEKSVSIKQDLDSAWLRLS
jgi:hypothetical protein